MSMKNNTVDTKPFFLPIVCDPMTAIRYSGQIFMKFFKHILVNSLSSELGFNVLKNKQYWAVGFMAAIRSDSFR